MENSRDVRWRLNPEALQGLLQRLGASPEAAAREYNLLRGKLADFFDWRGAALPEDLADETLDRVAQKLEEGRTVDNFTAFVYGVARNISLEAERRSNRERAAFAELQV